MSTENGFINQMNKTETMESGEADLLRRIVCLETQLSDFTIMLGQHNKQIYRMTIMISDLLKKLESTGDKNL